MFTLREGILIWYLNLVARYAKHLSSAGEIVLFDRSWYNRSMVEPVMGFCTERQHHKFLKDAPDFEKMIVDEGIQICQIRYRGERVNHGDLEKG